VNERLDRLDDYLDELQAHTAPADDKERTS
jgi:hypothetical protein